MKTDNYINKIGYLMISILLILLLVTTYKYSKKEKALINKINSTMVLNNIIKDNLFTQYEISNSILNTNQHIYNFMNDTISINRIFDNKKLLFRIFGNCTSCNSQTITNTLKYLNNKIQAIDTNNIMLIINLNNINELNTFKKNNHIKFPVYYIKHSTNLIPFENNQRGFYLATVSSSQTLENVFIPITNDDYYTEKYLEYILPNL